MIDMRQKVGEGIAGWVAAHREPILLRDVGDCARYPDLKFNYPSLTSTMVVPILLRDEIVGVINVTSNSPDITYDDDDLRAFQVFAENAGACIRHAEHVHWLKQMIPHLKKPFQETRRGRRRRSEIAEIHYDDETGHTLPEATSGRAKNAILPELERLLRELARGREPQIGEEIERSIIARIDAYQRAVIKSVEALCANALVNARDIERLSCIVASLPETNTERYRSPPHSHEHRETAAATPRFRNGRRASSVSSFHGKSNREISEALGISDKTVKNHLWKIYRKLGVGNRSQLFHKLIS